MSFISKIAGVALGCALALPALAQPVTGAGATFPSPLYQKWSEAAKGPTGITLNYQSVGSGAGQAQIRNRTVDFGASDAPMTDAQLKENNLLQFPATMGSLVAIVNLPGIADNQMKLTGDVLADIREGLAFVRVTPGLRYTLALVGLMSLTIVNFNVIIPYFARAVYGLREGGFGVLNASFGAGAMIGALWQASRPNPLKNLRLGAVLLLLSGLALALAPGGVIAALVLACCGFSMLTFLISANSSVQLTVPDALRGRVMSVYSLVLVGSGPLGALISSNLIAQGRWPGPMWGLIVLVALAAVSLGALWRFLPSELSRPA